MKRLLFVPVLLFAIQAHAVVTDIDAPNSWAASAANGLISSGWTTENCYDELSQYSFPEEAWEGWLSSRGYPTDYVVWSGGWFSEQMDLTRSYLDGGYGVTMYLSLLDMEAENRQAVVTPISYDSDFLRVVYALDDDNGGDYVCYDLLYSVAPHPLDSSIGIISLANRWYISGVAAIKPPMQQSSVPEPTALALCLLSFLSLPLILRRGGFSR